MLYFFSIRIWKHKRLLGYIHLHNVATVSRAAWINDCARIRNCQHHKFTGAVANRANIMALLDVMFDTG